MKSCLLWIPSFFLPPFPDDFWLLCEWFYDNGPKSQRNTEIFRLDPTEDDGAEITLQYSKKIISKLTLHNGSWPTCTRRIDITEPDHLHSRLQFDFYSHLQAGTDEKDGSLQLQKLLIHGNKQVWAFLVQIHGPLKHRKHCLCCLAHYDWATLILYCENVQTVMVVHLGLLFFLLLQKVPSHVPKTSLNAFKHREFSYRCDQEIIFQFSRARNNCTSPNRLLRYNLLHKSSSRMMDLTLSAATSRQSDVCTSTFYE